MHRPKLPVAFFILLLGGLAPPLAGAMVLPIAPIDLTDSSAGGNFFADPPPDAIFNPDGSVTFNENALAFSVGMSNDPGLGDPDLFTTPLGAGTVAAGVRLAFDFELSLPPGNADELSAEILDNTGSGIPTRSFVAGTAGMGTGTISLAGLDISPGGLGPIGLDFSLSPVTGDQGGTSSATIRNLRLEQVVQTVPTPEPPVALLLLAGLGLMAGGFRVRPARAGDRREMRRGRRRRDPPTGGPGFMCQQGSSGSRTRTAGNRFRSAGTPSGG